MAETMTTTAERVEQVGPDRVTITDQQVVIEAKRPMPDWQVRELNPAPVYFQDQKYYLVEERHTQGAYAMRYVLLPWPVGQPVASKIFYTYDAEAVAERDGECRSRQFEDLVHAFLTPLYPFLGLLWSGVQRRLGRFGFVAHTISGLSIFTVFGLLFSQGVFAVVMINASARSGKVMIGGLIRAMVSGDAIHLGPLAIPVLPLDSLLLLVLLADVIMRYNRYLRDDQWAGGFLEWLVPRAWRKDETSRSE